MLELRSNRWRELRDAYGNASDIPELLEKLKTASAPTSPEAEPWFSLWSALCHQYDVYTASYAAVPHLIAVAAAKPGRQRFELLHLVSAIEACRHRSHAPPMPDDLQPAYFAALEQATSLIIDSLKADWDGSEFQVLLGALAIMRRKHELGWAIIELEKEVECPECETLFTARGYDLFDKS